MLNHSRADQHDVDSALDREHPEDGGVEKPLILAEFGGKQRPHHRADPKKDVSCGLLDPTVADRPQDEDQTKPHDAREE